MVQDLKTVSTTDVEVTEEHTPVAPSTSTIILSTQAHIALAAGTHSELDHRTSFLVD